ncbi:MAG: hypothetical protein MJ138_07950, partial [Kiritimatiellae bacterium]|nr:hypothetical protein [Kiritimatiellia bacterium]
RLRRSAFCAAASMPPPPPAPRRPFCLARRQQCRRPLHFPNSPTPQLCDNTQKSRYTAGTFFLFFLLTAVGRCGIIWAEV